MTISESEPGRGPNEKLDSAHVVCWPAIDTPSLEHANFPGHSDSAGIQVLMTRAPVKHLRQCGLLSSGGPTGPEGTAEIALGVLDRLEPGCTTRGGLLAERLSKNRPLSEPVRHSRHLSGAGRCRTLLYSFLTCESPFENVLLLRFNFQIVGDVCPGQRLLPWLRLIVARAVALHVLLSLSEWQSPSVMRLNS